MLKGNKGKIIIASLAILGCVLILLGSFQGKSKNKGNYENYVDTLEEKLEEFLRGVDGIKEADVIIMLDEYENYDVSSSVFSSNDEKPTTVPKIRGVAVAVSNGDSYAVQLKVSSVVCSYLGISSNKVKIVAIK
jgi:type III secretory pathway lipoprotein EscJ